MVTVTLRETYDLSTKQGKMTLIGIHTPSKNIISRLWPGFCEQYKMCRILHQNVRVAAAARLPLDPLNVGANAEGQVSPEDVFNPILYKAVSNQSLSNLEYRIRGLSSAITVNGESAVTTQSGVTTLADEFNVYYSILSNTKGWKTAHPQRGLSMRKLRPLVFEKWFNEGLNRSDNNSLGDGEPITEYEDTLRSDTIPIDSSTSDAPLIGASVVESMRGRPHRMPAFNTKYLTFVPGAGEYVQNGMNSGFPANGQKFMPDIPRIFTGLILVPPSRNTTLYYRMVVETVIQFFGVQTMDEITDFGALNDRSLFPVYWNDYRSQTRDSDLKVEEDTVSLSEGAEIKKIMESGA